ncbi:Polyadenylate-binding protein-interacting protein 1 [Trichinella zimbabwensis]|uniref:Polyadenylate-binding protein-interacting protein 1 n=1 Tax=Trichinella zimbabwensis TaxID=268475 RepID=A0A0V1I2N7_9BILA|nr:Polyadenylate-binding protein-interacting protein 1 [Trichinella zimbabwensis]
MAVIPRVQYPQTQVHHRGSSSSSSSAAAADLCRDFSRLCNVQSTTATTPTSTSTSSSGTTFKWRLDAPEFVPLAMRQKESSAVGAAQSCLATAAAATTTATAAPATTAPQTVSVEQTNVMQYFLWELVNWLSQLYMEPAKYELIARQISGQLNCCVRTEHDLAAVVDKFFDVCMSYPHFSYQAARLSGHFNAQFTGCPDAPDLFRKLLLRRCHAELENRSSLLDSDQLAPRLHNFVIFLSELAAQTEQGAAPNEFALDALLELLQELLARQGDAHLRCALTALKCSGAMLLRHAPEQTRRLFAAIDDRSFLQRQSSSVLFLAKTLANCRRQWEQSAEQLRSIAEACESARDVAESVANSLLDHSDGVHYGPDGQPLTSEESDFLAEFDSSVLDSSMNNNNNNNNNNNGNNINTNTNNNNGDNSDVVLSEDDLQLAEAYEKFLMMVNTKNNQNQFNNQH